MSSYSRFSFSSETNVDSCSDEDVHTVENPGGGSSKFCQNAKGSLNFLGKYQRGVQHLIKPFFENSPEGSHMTPPYPSHPAPQSASLLSSFDSLIGTQGNLFTPQTADLGCLGKRGGFVLDFLKSTIPSNFTLIHFLLLICVYLDN